MWYFSLLGFEVGAGLVETLAFAGEIAWCGKLFFSLATASGAFNGGGGRRRDLFDGRSAISAFEIE
jgi:hypothetical protein